MLIASVGPRVSEYLNPGLEFIEERSTTMSNHAWAQENLAAYTMGGLSKQERADLEAHLADCVDCTLVLTDTRETEKVMDDLFASARPDSGLEDRVLQGFRRKPVRRANWLVFVGSAAAVLVLGLMGAIAQSLLEGGMLPGGLPTGTYAATQACAPSQSAQLPPFPASSALWPPWASAASALT